MASAIEQIAVERNKLAVTLRDQGKIEEARRALLDNAAFLSENAAEVQLEGTRGLRREEQAGRRSVSNLRCGKRNARRSSASRMPGQSQQGQGQEPEVKRTIETETDSDPYTDRAVAAWSARMARMADGATGAGSRGEPVPRSAGRAGCATSTRSSCGPSRNAKRSCFACWTGALTKPANCASWCARAPSSMPLFVLDPAGNRHASAAGWSAHRHRTGIPRTIRPDLARQASCSTTRRKAPARSSSHGWYTWYWGNGANLLFWVRDASGRVIGAECDRSRMLADIVGELPNSDPSDPNLQQGRIALTGGDGVAVYQWGAYEPAQDEAASRSAGPRPSARFLEPSLLCSARRERRRRLAAACSSILLPAWAPLCSP